MQGRKIGLVTKCFDEGQKIFEADIAIFVEVKAGVKCGIALFFAKVLCKKQEIAKVDLTIAVKVDKRRYWILILKDEEAVLEVAEIDQAIVRAGRPGAVVQAIEIGFAQEVCTDFSRLSRI